MDVDLSTPLHSGRRNLCIGKRSEQRLRLLQPLTVMKFSLSLALLAVFFISACSDVEEPPMRVRHRIARYPATGPEQYPPQQQPFNPNAPPPENVAPQEPTASAPAPAPTAMSARTEKGDHPYGIPVPGKPHVVESPFSPGKYVDVEGFPPGTEVKDPYTQKIFLVP
jgi:hypothetical protein